MNKTLLAAALFGLVVGSANVSAPETWCETCHQILASVIVMPLPAGTPICTPARAPGLMLPPLGPM